MEIDISILFQKPEKTVNSMLIIEPLAPLSMVSTMPGNFYKTLSEPSKFHLCGAFENALGWHFDEGCINRVIGKNGKKVVVRSQIKKSVEAYFKREKLGMIDWEAADSGYEPLVAHLFEINLVVKPALVWYNDLWKQLRRRKDGTYPHPNGTMNLSFEIIPLKMNLPRTEKGTVTNPGIADFFKEYSDQYPMYYSSPGNREFVVAIAGVYKMGIKMTEGLFSMLEIMFSENNIAYLGTNEGWVNLKIQRL